MNRTTRSISIAFCFIALSVLACEPVIAMGWKEIVFVFLLVAILFGPPFYRFLRRVEEFLKHEKKNKQR
jgi:hypothetical protein